MLRGNMNLANSAKLEKSIKKSYNFPLVDNDMKIHKDHSNYNRFLPRDQPKWAKQSIHIFYLSLITLFREQHFKNKNTYINSFSPFLAVWMEYINLIPGAF